MTGHGLRAPERGAFITLEGLEGVGKTTNREVIVDRLRAAGIDPVVTREPGGTELGEKLRDIVLDASGQLLASTELLLMTASRLEHVSRIIEPALASGHWVVCDRFVDASVAYQGGGRGLGIEFVERLQSDAGIEIEPDLTLLLDMPVDAGLARMRSRGEPDRIERESQAFFERARAAYLERAARAPERVFVVDASEALDEVARAIGDRLALFLAARRPSVDTRPDVR